MLERSCEKHRIGSDMMRKGNPERKFWISFFMELFFWIFQCDFDLSASDGIIEILEMVY